MTEIKFPPVPEWIGRVAHDRTGQGPRIWADADVLDYARAAVALNAPRWQPIADAPHEENVLLGWRDWDGAWITEVGMATWGWRKGAVSNMSAHGKATHYQSLPAGPEAA